MSPVLLNSHLQELAIKPLKAWLCIASACVIVGVLFWCRDDIAAQLNDWKLLPKPEPLTELYFTKEVQHTAQAGGVQTLVFLVRNLEHRTVGYSFKIVATAQNNDYVLKTGNITLAHTNTQILTEQVTLPNTKGKMQVRVELEHSPEPARTQPVTQTQTIHYWITVAHTKEAWHAA